MIFNRKKKREVRRKELLSREGRVRHELRAQFLERADIFFSEAYSKVPVGAYMTEVDFEFLGTYEVKWERP